MDRGEGGDDAPRAWRGVGAEFPAENLDRTRSVKRGHSRAKQSYVNSG